MRGHLLFIAEYARFPPPHTFFSPLRLNKNFQLQKKQEEQETQMFMKCKALSWAIATWPFHNSLLYGAQGTGSDSFSHPPLPISFMSGPLSNLDFHAGLAAWGFRAVLVLSETEECSLCKQEWIKSENFLLAL